MLKNPFKKNSLVNKYQSLINQINILENDLKTLSDSELRAKSFKLKKQYEDNQNLNSLIAESFALTREASLRTLGLRHFDVQLIGGLVLNNQKIAEMKTGEGKTLVATLPAFLNALTKKGVHIVTVNDYLANRDQVSMGQIYRFLRFRYRINSRWYVNFRTTRKL
jgi:preprotein translocase subunit SecA